MDILNRWKKHSCTLLNQPGSADLSVLDSILPADIVEDLEAAPTLEEISKALKQLSSGKAPGPDAIPAEVLKFGGPALLSNLHKLFLTIWESETGPQGFKDGILLKLYKKKNKFDCGNYRGITLLSIVGKLFAKVVLNRIWPSIKAYLSEAQCSFRGGRSKVDRCLYSNNYWRNAESNNRNCTLCS